MLLPPDIKIDPPVEVELCPAITFTDPAALLALPVSKRMAPDCPAAAIPLPRRTEPDPTPTEPPD